jgi:hypothetical protein
LTCDFWAENGKEKIMVTAKGNKISRFEKDTED